MQGFDPIVIEWNGEQLSIAPESQMELILRVEEGLTQGKGGQAALVLSHPEGPPIGRSCQVFADILRYAGLRVEDLEVFHAVHKDIREGEGNLILKIQETFMLILGLVSLDDLEVPEELKKEAPPQGPTED